MKIPSNVLTVFCCSVATLSLAQTNRTADEISMAEKMELAKPYHTTYAEAEKPFTVIDNIHSVGAKNIGVYLITTDAGHILIDTGVREMHDVIVNNVEALGFAVKDIKILLSTHAHFDHVQGHEAMRKASNANVMAVGLDAEALRRGEDISPLGFEGWEPVQNVTTLQHGDTVSLGNTALTAHEIPGHTQGCTVWTLPATSGQQTYQVAIFGCRGPNANVQVQGNPRFPDLVEQTQLGFDRLAEIKADIYLSNHPQRVNEKYAAAMAAGNKPHPLLQQQPWQEMVAEIRAGFAQRLKDE